MSVIGKVSAIFTASTTGLVTGVNKARSEFTRLEGSVSKMRGSLNALTAIQGAQLFAGIATGAANAARSLAGMADATANAVIENTQLANKVGLNLATFTALSEAADEVGISQMSVARAVQTMGQSLLRLEAGEQKATAAFKAIGLAASDLEGMAPEQAFGRIVDEIAKLPTPAERTAAAMKVFGKTGRELEPLFQAGSEAIRNATQEVNLFGTALDTQAGQNVMDMKNAFGDVADAFAGFKTQVLAAFAPAVTQTIEGLLQKLADAGGMVPVAMQFSRIMATTVGTMVDAAIQFSETITTALGQVQSTFGYVQAFAKGGYAVAQRAAAGLETAAGMVAASANESFEGTASRLFDSAQSRINSANKASAEADALFFGGGTLPGSGEQTVGSRFSETMLQEIDRLEAGWRERTKAANLQQPKDERAPAAAARSNGGVADLMSRAGTNLKMQAEMLAQLKAIARAAAQPKEQPVVFNLAGAGGR